jgi:hypothetical protein
MSRGRCSKPDTVPVAATLKLVAFSTTDRPLSSFAHLAVLWRWHWLRRCGKQAAWATAAGLIASVVFMDASSLPFGCPRTIDRQVPAQRPAAMRRDVFRGFCLFTAPQAPASVSSWSGIVC